MAGSLSKHEELLQKLIPDLQCHECKNVPGPIGNQMNRYSCTKAAHTLCEEHKTKCACGSKVVESPSPIIAKLLENLPWMCQNYQTGCRESKINVEDLEFHHRNCIYRLVFCPNVDCEFGRQSLFKDVLDHLKICMSEAIYEEEMLKVAEHNFDTCIERYIFNLDIMENGTTWPPSKLTSTCGGVFFVSGCIENDTFYLWCCLLGSSDEAKKYSGIYSVTNQIGQEFIYKGPVSTLDDKSDDIITSGSLLGIRINAAKRSLNSEKELWVKITIRNLKEEAKDDDMESGVSNDDMESSGVSDGE